MGGRASAVTPIQPVLLGSSEAALGAQRELLAARFCVVAIRPPNVPQGSARLRVTLSAVLGFGLHHGSIDDGAPLVRLA